MVLLPDVHRISVAYHVVTPPTTPKKPYRKIFSSKLNRFSLLTNFLLADSDNASFRPFGLHRLPTYRLAVKNLKVFVYEIPLLIVDVGSGSESGSNDVTHGIADGADGCSSLCSSMAMVMSMMSVWMSWLVYAFGNPRYYRHRIPIDATPNETGI
ncbi:Hypothetical predicted protein [Octopus vulgaris]|uniref:Uncharacterized protein n=1 Tax=Octopus vulgaris TaxID=6645 RepID=A0AA36F670_OCTVU|nr:Hypothetical predicted protein [Octopus vulgaris]